VVQINGKLRDILIVSQEEGKIQLVMESMAKQRPKIAVYLEQGTIKKTIFVPGKLINFVVG